MLQASHATKYLGEIASGEKIATVALLERDASWDPGRHAHAYPRGRQTLCAGRSGVADWIVVAARDATKLALYLVDRTEVKVTPMPGIDLTRRLYKVTFDHPGAELLAKGDAARHALDHAMDIATVALCAEMTGGMQRMLDIAVEYAKTRKQFGNPIGQYQAVQARTCCCGRKVRDRQHTALRGL